MGLRHDGDLQQVADHWSTADSWETPSGRYWLQLAEVQRRCNLKASGSADADWVEHALATHLSGRLQLARCLSLGCGAGRLERQLAARGAFVACDACDIAQGQIQKAREAARTAGYEHIHYAVADLNRIEVAEGSYDAAWAHGSVHHVMELEHLFAQVARALKPGGLFVLNEYVGPNRFQFPLRQRQVIQACNDLLPPDYRRVVAARLQEGVVRLDAAHRSSLARRVLAKLRGGGLGAALRRRARHLVAQRTGTRPPRHEVALPSAASVAAIDPSEAVRSAEIMPLLRKTFEVLEYRPLGGGLLHFLLADIAGNFETGEGERLLAMLFHIEDTLMAAGDLSSDFAYVVAVPRRVPNSEER